MAGPYSLTATGAKGEPKGHNVGVHVINSVFSAGNMTAAQLASTTGLTLLMAKIASGQRVLAIQRNFGGAAGTGGSFDMGLGTSLSCFANSLTAIEGIGWVTTGVPKLNSMSDSAKPAYRYLTLTNSQAAGIVSLTTGGTISLQIFLTNDKVGGT